MIFGSLQAPTQPYTQLALPVGNWSGTRGGSFPVGALNTPPSNWKTSAVSNAHQLRGLLTKLGLLNVRNGGLRPELAGILSNKWENRII